MVPLNPLSLKVVGLNPNFRNGDLNSAILHYKPMSVLGKYFPSKLKLHGCFSLEKRKTMSIVSHVVCSFEVFLGTDHHITVVAKTL